MGMSFMQPKIFLFLAEIKDSKILFLGNIFYSRKALKI
jgi:hypothetical protein